MTRTYAISGSASGIGKATSDKLTAEGHRVIGIDLKDADVIADLADPASRDSLYEKVSALAPEGLDGVLAIAGGPAEVNYLGAVATLEGLRPLLEKSKAPRALVVTSFAAIFEVDEALLDAYLSGDEEAIAEVSAATKPDFYYSTSKRAMSYWVRRQSILPEWAGKGIALNAVAPGTIITPMTAPYLATEEGMKTQMSMVPMPLNGPAQPEAAASLLAWLTSEENSHVTGQVIFIDGGADATLRGYDIF